MNSFTLWRCSRCRSLQGVVSARHGARTFSRSSPGRDEDGKKTKPITSDLSSLFASNRPPPAPRSDTDTPTPTPAMQNVDRVFSRKPRPAGSQSSASDAGGLDVDSYDRSASSSSASISPLDRFTSLQRSPPHHLHIYSTKHNTHITLTRPDRNPIISVSAGNIGFRKGARGEYDAAYQLAAYVMNRIQDQGLLREIRKLELVLRGWGVGREAVSKVILGSEGRYLRGRVVQVTDATRLKFGGTRSPKPRRLG